MGPDTRCERLFMLLWLPLDMLCSLVAASGVHAFCESPRRLHFEGLLLLLERAPLFKHCSSKRRYRVMELQDMWPASAIEQHLLQASSTRTTGYLLCWLEAMGS